MKKLFSLIVSTLATLSLSAQGWPAQYEGVMLQGFYWDSFSQSQWVKLEKQADELSQYFSLVWLPQSADCGGHWHHRRCGYQSPQERQQLGGLPQGDVQWGDL